MLDGNLVATSTLGLRVVRPRGSKNRRLFLGRLHACINEGSLLTLWSEWNISMTCVPKHLLDELGADRREEGRRIMTSEKIHYSHNPMAEIERLRAVNAKLLEALRDAATYRHAAHSGSFQECHELGCKRAREAIKEATE